MSCPRDCCRAVLGFEADVPRAELLEITPAQALALVAGCDHQPETLDFERIGRFVACLRSGTWPVNGETVAFWPDGTVRNGRHRLYACAAAGIPLRTWVIFGTDP